MAKDRGKEFEKLFENATLVIDDVDIQRLYDVIGKKTIEQPADYVCYKYPNEIYVECKSTHSTSFDYYNQPQYSRLINKSSQKGVKAGMLVWYVNSKEVFWLDIEFLQAFYSTNHIKSLTVNRLNSYITNHIDGVFKIDQTTKRVNPEMHLESMFNYITREV